MPRNGSGTYALPAGNPVTNGTTIEASWANSTLTDIATALTNSIAKDGETAWTGPDDHNGNEIILDADGDTSITADTDDQIDFKVGGADRVSMTSTAVNITVPVSTDTITESTPDAGVTVDGVLLKDNTITASGSISFGNENLTTTGTITGGGLTLSNGVISRSTEQISLGSNNTLSVSNNTSTTQLVLGVNGSALTTGGVAQFSSFSSSTSTRNVLSVLNTSSAATGTALINLQQDAAAPIIRIAPGTSSGSGVTTALTTRTTPGSIAGFMQITVAGNKRWIAFYNDPS